MSLNSKKILLITFSLALMIRIFKLGVFPFGFHIDEVKVGWNSYSVLKTGLTDQMKSLGLYYDSFGDFRPTGIFYSTIPFIALFGKNIFAVRVSSSLFGALTVIPLFFLAKKISKNESIAYLSAFLLAISPWHIEVSRATSEVVISTFFAIFSFYYLVELIHTKKVKFLYLNLLFILIAYLFYHSIRLLAPIIFIVIAIYYKKFNRMIMFSILGAILFTLFFTFSNHSLKRLNQVSIFKDIDINYELQKSKSNKMLIYSKHLSLNYLDYFGSSFLIGNSARPYRYITPGFGLMTITEYLLFIFGVIAIVRKKFDYLPIIILLLAPIPAVLTSEDIPNLHRAFLMLPFLSIICAFGIEYLGKYKYLLLTLLIINFIYFLKTYFHTYSQIPYLKNFSIDSPTYRNVGAVELAKKIPILSKNYEKIVITNFPDSTHPWFTFFNNIDPKIFNKTYNSNSPERVWENIIFSDLKCPADDGLIIYNHQNVLFVEAWECSYEAQIKDGYPLEVVDKILRPDGSLVYVFLTRDTTKPLIVDGKEIK